MNYNDSNDVRAAAIAFVCGVLIALAVLGGHYRPAGNDNASAFQMYNICVGVCR